MKKIKISVLLLSGAILLGSCSTMNNTAKGGVIGGGSGAAGRRIYQRPSGHLHLHPAPEPGGPAALRPGGGA